MELETIRDEDLLDEFAVEELEVRLEMSHGVCYHFPCLRWDTDWLGNRACGLRSNFSDDFRPLTGTMTQAQCTSFAATTTDPTGWVFAAYAH